MIQRLEDFLGNRAQPLLAQGTAITPRLSESFNPRLNAYRLSTHTTNRGLAYPIASPHRSSWMVQEC
jgi:hypothetical protein